GTGPRGPCPAAGRRSWMGTRPLAQIREDYEYADVFPDQDGTGGPVAHWRCPAGRSRPPRRHPPRVRERRRTAVPLSRAGRIKPTGPPPSRPNQRTPHPALGRPRRLRRLAPPGAVSVLPIERSRPRRAVKHPATGPPPAGVVRPYLPPPACPPGHRPQETP